MQYSCTVGFINIYLWIHKSPEATWILFRLKLNTNCNKLFRRETQLCCVPCQNNLLQLVITLRHVMANKIKEFNRARKAIVQTYRSAVLRGRKMATHITFNKTCLKNSISLNMHRSKPNTTIMPHK